jgi:hypothetical protein
MKLKEIAYVVKNSLLFGLSGFFITWVICRLIGIDGENLMRTALIVSGYMLVFVGFYGSLVRLLRKPL